VRTNGEKNFEKRVKEGLEIVKREAIKWKVFMVKWKYSMIKMRENMGEKECFE
jgi:hypothetical protein